MNTSKNRVVDVLQYHFKSIISLFDDERITDIEVNPDSMIFVHYVDGSSEYIDLKVDSKSIAAVAAIMAAELQNDVSEDNPSVAAVWPDPALRIHIILPPAVKAPCMVIRRPSSMVFTLEELVDSGTCTTSEVKKIRDLIIKRKNIIVSGETGSGKTTLLNTLLAEIPTKDRLYIVEDTRELICKAPNQVSILTGNKYSARQAIKDSLRFRPDRIIVGEVRDGAALDLLEAWNTGHPGGLCSIHANSPNTVKLRLKSLIQQVSISPQEDLINTTVDAIIQMTLCSDGIRRITEIKEF